MRTWEYRITRQAIEGVDDVYEYEIREVYFDGDRVVSWTESASAPYSESLEGFREDLIHYLAAWTKPVIDLDEERKKL